MNFTKTSGVAPDHETGLDDQLPLEAPELPVHRLQPGLPPPPTHIQHLHLRQGCQGVAILHSRAVDPSLLTNLKIMFEASK